SSRRRFQPSDHFSTGIGKEHKKHSRQIVGQFFSPPLRGGVAARSTRCRGASLTRADGVVCKFQHILFEFDHHPVRSIKEVWQYLIIVAAPPPRRGGEKRRR